jgi:hypothetical protein
MFFKRRPKPEPAATAKVIADDVLGDIRFNPEEGHWEVQIASNPTWQICIAGSNSPDPALLLHAHDIAINRDRFEEMVTAFLKEQAANIPEAQDEILSLKLESLYLYSPDRPNDGMIFFAGGEDDWLWRCDYIGRKPQGLGFDT